MISNRDAAVDRYYGSKTDPRCPDYIEPPDWECPECGHDTYELKTRYNRTPVIVCLTCRHLEEDEGEE